MVPGGGGIEQSDKESRGIAISVVGTMREDDSRARAATCHLRLIISGSPIVEIWVARDGSGI